MNKNLNYRKLPQKSFKVVNMHYQNDRKMGFLCQSMPDHKSFEKRIIVYWSINLFYLLALHFCQVSGCPRSSNRYRVDCQWYFAIFMPPAAPGWLVIDIKMSNSVLANLDISKHRLPRWQMAKNHSLDLLSQQQVAK